MFDETHSLSDPICRLDFTATDPENVKALEAILTDFAPIPLHEALHVVVDRHQHSIVLDGCNAHQVIACAGTHRLMVQDHMMTGFIQRLTSGLGYSLIKQEPKRSTGLRQAASS